MATVNVRFFGPAREWAGLDALPLDLPDGATVGVVAGQLADRFPTLGAALGIRLAVNRSFVPLDVALRDGDEVAVIPPVSGG